MQMASCPYPAPAGDPIHVLANVSGENEQTLCLSLDEAFRNAPRSTFCKTRMAPSLVRSKGDFFFCLACTLRARIEPIYPSCLTEDVPYKMKESRNISLLFRVTQKRYWQPARARVCIALCYVCIHICISSYRFFIIPPGKFCQAFETQFSLFFVFLPLFPSNNFLFVLRDFVASRVRIYNLTIFINIIYTTFAICRRGTFFFFFFITVWIPSYDWQWVSLKFQPRMAVVYTSVLS